MLTLRGVVRATAQIGGGINRKTGEKIPLRDVVQVEGSDERGLVQVYTLTIPDASEFEEKIGSVIELPVRAWATGAAVNLAYRG